MAVVFIDVYFIYNFIINLILLLSAKLLCIAKTNGLRLASGAFLGAVYSVCHMVFGIDGIISAVSKITVSILMILISFFNCSFKQFCKHTGVFMAVNFIYGGALYFFMHFFNTGIYFGGGNFYVDINITTLVLTSFLIYTAIYFVKRTIENKLIFSKRIYNLEVTLGAKTVNINALADTGNSLFEPLSGAPVILIEEGVLDENDINITTYRFIPYKSAGGSGYMIAFSVDNLKINNKKTEILVYAAIFSGILSRNGEYRAILHPLLMSHESKQKEMCGIDN